MVPIYKSTLLYNFSQLFLISSRSKSVTSIDYSPFKRPLRGWAIIKRLPPNIYCLGDSPFYLWINYPSLILFTNSIFDDFSSKSCSVITSVVNAISPSTTGSINSTFPNAASTSAFDEEVLTKNAFLLSL